MRKFGKGWILLAMIGAILFLVIFGSRTSMPEEYDFIREFNPRDEFVGSMESRAPGSSHEIWYRTFVFDNISPDLFAKMKDIDEPVASGPDVLIYVLPNARMAFLHKSSNRIIISEPVPSWVARQWIYLKQKMGLNPPTAL